MVAARPLRRRVVFPAIVRKCASNAYESPGINRIHGRRNNLCRNRQLLRGRGCRTWQGWPSRPQAFSDRAKYPDFTFTLTYGPSKLVPLLYTYRPIVKKDVEKYVSACESPTRPRGIGENSGLCPIGNCREPKRLPSLM